MYKIVMYTDDHGYCPIEEFIKQLDRKSLKDKNSRIQLKQIIICFNILCKFGTRSKSEYVEFIDNGIWQLRPGSNRILFTLWKNNNFLLLHSFHKDTKRTPRREKIKARKEFEDWVSRHGH